MQQRATFEAEVGGPWRLAAIGAGRVQRAEGRLRLELPEVSAASYHDAQISDYTGRKDFRWRPPVRLTVRAWMERRDGFRGTAGFGFWNHPFVPGERGFRLPQAAWFFYATPPNDMRLAQGVAGAGWKAATLDATRPAFLALLPTAPVGFLLMRVPALYHRLWPVAQRAMGVSEGLLDAGLLDEPHTYTLDWRREGISYAVDGETVHEAPYSPRGRLGFIAWIDNQYAVVTPQGQFGFGLVGSGGALVVEEVEVYSRQSIAISL